MFVCVCRLLVCAMFIAIKIQPIKLALLLNVKYAATMKSAVLFLTLLILLTPVLSDELVYALEYSRHGARYPRYAHLSWNLLPMGLTSAGMRQHYLLGRALRRRYVDDLHLISPVYNPEEVAVYASGIPRCIASAEAQVQGLYPHGTGRNLTADGVVDPPNPDYERFADWSREMGPNSLPHGLSDIPVRISARAVTSPESLCPKMMKAVEKSQDKRDSNSAHRTLYQELGHEFDLPAAQAANMTLQKASELRDALIVGVYEGRFDDAHTKDLINRTSVLYYMWKYESLLGVQLQEGVNVSRVVVTPFLRRIKKGLLRALDGKERNGPKNTKMQPRRKLEIFTGSDTLMQSLLKELFGIARADVCPFASTLLLELYRNASSGQFYVRVMYNLELNTTFALKEFIQLLDRDDLDPETYGRLCTAVVGEESGLGPGFEATWRKVALYTSVIVGAALLCVVGICFLMRRRKNAFAHQELEPPMTEVQNR